MNKCSFVLLVLLSLFSIPALASWEGGKTVPEILEDEGGQYYAIATPEEFAWYADYVNSGETSANAILVQDIVLGEDTNSVGSVPWTPIGKDSSVLFQGMFNGNGHSVFGVNVSEPRFSGLFGVIGNKGSVKNLSLKSSNFVHTGFGGSIVGFNNGLIENCSNEGHVSSGRTYSKTGGIAGVNAGVIKKCVNRGPIKYSHRGYSYDINYVGGIAGINTGTLSICANYADISVYSYDESSAGGIAGHNDGVIEISFNVGAVADTTYEWTNRTGGVVGYNTKIVRNCYNQGTVFTKSSYGSRYAGGIIAVNSESATVSQSYSATELIEGKYLGGGVASNGKSAKVAYSFFDNSLWNGSFCNSCEGNISNSSARSTEQMQSKEFVWILNTANGSSTNSGVWSYLSDHYPVFTGFEQSYSVYRVVFDINGEKTVVYTDSLGQIDFPEIPEAPEGDNLEFVGWYNEDGELVDTLASLTSDAVITPKFEQVIRWQIRFADYDGREIASDRVVDGHFPVIPESPSRESSEKFDYVFNAWSPEVVAATESADYIAIYDSSLVKYHLVFDIGETHIDAFVEYGMEFELPDALDSLGYTFEGWYLNDEEGNVGEKLGGSGDKIVVTHEISVIAVYEINSSSSGTSSSSTDKTSSSSAKSSSSTSDKKSSSSKGDDKDAINVIAQAPQFSMSVAGRALQIAGAEANAKVAVFDLRGNVMYSGFAYVANLSIEMPRSGSYLVRVGSQTQRVNVK